MKREKRLTKRERKDRAEFVRVTREQGLESRRWGPRGTYAGMAAMLAALGEEHERDGFCPIGWRWDYATMQRAPTRVAGSLVEEA